MCERSLEARAPRQNATVTFKETLTNKTNFTQMWHLQISRSARLRGYLGNRSSRNN